MARQSIAIGTAFALGTEGDVVSAKIEEVRVG